MDNEIPLPPPPRIRHRSPSKPTTASSLQKTYHLSRFDDRSSQPSSDPALFSSDDIPASGLENYHAPAVSGGRKRRYRGTWWGEMVKDPKRKRADFKEKRCVDSGVWMGSDESEAVVMSDVSNWGEELLRRDGGGVGAGAGAGIEGDIGGSAGAAQLMSMQQRAGFRVVEEPREHLYARGIVNDCLEKGLDCVDLSGGNLRIVPSGLLRPLQHLMKLPTVKEAPVTEDGYSSLEPFLRLFLAGNSLTAVSGELFELESLRVLSLRNNKLTAIPPAIRRLTMLQELNLSVNRLEVLPWELLWLIKKGDLKHLTVQPNPLMQIDDAQIAQWHSPAGTMESGTTEPDMIDSDTPDSNTPESNTPRALKLCEYEGPAPEEAWAPIHVATGPVRRFNMEGMAIETQTNYTNAPTPNEGSSRVPSLREVSLLAFNKAPFFDQIPDSEMADYPGLILRLLRQAREVRTGGGRSCSICHRSFVIARTEWVEWWDCSTYENGLKGPRCSGEILRPLPFRRLGCSWACVPDGEGDQTGLV